jgi:diaminopimelate decarboxylase
MLLPKEEIKRFVRGYFKNRDKYTRATDREGTPLYILEPDVLIRRATEFRRAFTDKLDECGFYFAVKSNNHPMVSETVLKSGFGLDVSSGNELKTALTLGAEDIIFTGPGKSTGELNLAVENHKKVTILLDSFSELHAVEKIAASKRAAIRAGVRLATNNAGLWRKFGIALDDLLLFFEQAGNCPHVNMQGLQFHTSWNLSPKAQSDFIGLLGKKLAAYPAYIRETIQFIDVGGGYWPRQGEWLHADSTEKCTNKKKRYATDSPCAHYYHPAASIETFAEEISRAIHGSLDFLFPCSIRFEPGRWICNDSMHLMMSITDKKAPDLVITDAGMNAIGWERFETDYFPILNLTRPSLDEKPCNICGSLCTPDDNFGFSYFGEDICIGDILLIPCQGAYTYSLRQEFIKSVPRVIVVSD